MNDQSSGPAADLTTDEKIALTGGQDFWHLHSFPDKGLPDVMVSDGPHGLRTQKGDSDMLGLNDSVEATCFPPAVGLSATWSPRTAGAVAAAIAEEARAEGVSVVLGPGMNIKRSPLCGRNFEYFSEDPHLAGEMAVGYVDGMQDAGVGTSIKHFALNNQETDRMRVDVEVDERTKQEIYLRAFRSVVTRSQPWTVMCSYNSVGGTLVSQNHHLLTEVLRDQWGFEGVVVSDWGAVVDRPASVAAGLDLQMPADTGAEQDLRDAVAAGDYDQGALDRAADRVAALILRSAENADPDAAYDRDEHHAVARDAARKAIVLLTNDGTLPLAPDADVAVVGDFAQTPRYQGAGSSHVIPTRLSSALDAIREATGTEVPFARGFVPGDKADSALVEEAVEVARNAGTVLVFLGLGEDVESEGYDRTDMELPAEQVALLQEIQKVNDRVVVLLSNGSAVRFPSALLDASAVLETWLLGQAGGEAVADVLFGAVTPSGKLAETVPLRLEDVPSFLHFPGEASRVQYGEGLFVGYRGFDARGLDVQFPFGYGLSYTTFDYSDLELSSDDDGIHVALTVANTGERAGREVVQAYVSVPGSKVARAPRELKGFAEVELEAGASERVELTLAHADLQYWSVALHGWAVEGGTYHVAVGASSRDLRLEGDVEVTGDETIPEVTGATTPLEIAEMPGGEEKLESFMSSIGLMADPEMRKMAEQIPIGRLTGIGNVSREDLAAFIDSLNQR
ncbi:glycoside hydrolase family 3 C-terminal domain-containing protein [Brachybacterium huguangmaarense]|uniref:Glycoside hydrolase family 3 C-terminal domain-containing protein n=1 Tax=Brachybacterium huguangmaarense TaxID=1652028 RepID=A0ABY6G295_9MICO|nr:glycoside hydrolase family 3 C-terminal domain-containing protein [Brachybacterium huguangmaarense]UYG17328.1 glycoside hydrolase family 3 C-terminal domain-containing protein [Brachybacterium huguangmaarense]